ncbi:hypothetical protein M409DRAFT_58340 [Zasmidium cellare ATCC 36951]|uniref:Uncharacterized protein n=1 Tax=Zasmidium cellare ATCC 36951 TaxID=1080233 RepID=A0A6A6C7P1_ZASCE|nr:uncharacterized protein M409DRAFT_58340 [Zasmidium cellare ATCC 36951]KAF2162220.1 hypothetical protein M409DRAFT_58340 [Zasmidium cellare ATCC 36951]
MPGHLEVGPHLNSCPGVHQCDLFCEPSRPNGMTCKLSIHANAQLHVTVPAPGHGQDVGVSPLLHGLLAVVRIRVLFLLGSESSKVIDGCTARLPVQLGRAHSWCAQWLEAATDSRPLRPGVALKLTGGARRFYTNSRWPLVGKGHCQMDLTDLVLLVRGIPAPRSSTKEVHLRGLDAASHEAAYHGLTPAPSRQATTCAAACGGKVDVGVLPKIAAVKRCASGV